jgi:hypothetical protein
VIMGFARPTLGFGYCVFTLLAVNGSTYRSHLALQPKVHVSGSVLPIGCQQVGWRKRRTTVMQTVLLSA